jgi:FAD/FMN-containing dehydrogenase/Fe-S oxidoreductase
MESVIISPDAPQPVQGIREVPFNYTSADDPRALSLILPSEHIRTLEELRGRRVTGRSARLLMRFFGELLIHHRNPFLYQELLDSATRRRRLFGNAEKALSIIERNANGEARVLEVLKVCHATLSHFRAEIDEAPERRRRIKRELGAIIGTDNVLFDPFSIVSHATDATDWRLFLPLVVVMPDKEEQVAPLLTAIAHLGLKAVPRGAGTGLTGGAVPLHPDCVVINAEKLNHIRGIRPQRFQLDDGSEREAAVVEVEAGVITEKAMEYAEERGLVFATDPTSAWASSIGGNIAENAGGKMAVRWGTCIDNLVEWRMAMPTGRTWIIHRTDHRLRKILPQDTVTFEVVDASNGQLAKRIELMGSEIRKKGLWKDITNKALKGLPGMQKEGTDGVITSARFVLYPKFEAQRTLCLEFFGADMDEASRAIQEITKAFPFPDEGKETLLALEHFDDEYVRAINYKVKAARAETPKAVLLIDVVGHSDEEARTGVERIRTILEHHGNTELFEARNAAEGKVFWNDRKRLSAIAKRTNAFKMNEDIVIPIEVLADFTRFIDELNIHEERHTQRRFLTRAEAIFRRRLSTDDGESLAAKLPTALERCAQARETLEGLDEHSLRAMTALKSLRSDIQALLRGYPAILEELDEVSREVRDRRIVLATHMHAGDGNVHVNVPVMSNDREMLDRADHVIDIVMAKVMEMGGVVSGEHGIGVTKLKYMEKARIEELSAYRKEVDPAGLMNPGKLEDYEALKRIFTPSFNLLELEARILQYGQLEELARRIAHCIRCGKCKPDCCVFHPARSLFFHPRNKNLAIGSLIEAMLYDAQRGAQRKRSEPFELLRWLEEVADHCTICHKCATPCPVDIDTGEVSILEREILLHAGYKHKPIMTQATLGYLESRSNVYNKLFRASVLRLGGAAQRIGQVLAAPLQPKEGSSPLYPLRLVKSSMPPVPADTLRDLLPPCEPDQAMVFEPEGEATGTVFYFPGCGSERMFSDISMAAIHVLIQLGTRVVLPPPFLCCGFPSLVNGKQDQYASLVLRDTILFNQIREMFSHLHFDACIITCGTCREGLEKMEAEHLFGDRLLDVAQYALEKGLKLESDGTSEGFLYHAPCHDSLGGKAIDVISKLGSFGSVKAVPHCCSEAGTLSVSRPDITDAMLHRKREALKEALHESKSAHATILTNCPSCIQGLGRNRKLAQPKHLAVALAERISGPDWIEKFKQEAAKAVALTF